MQFDIYVSIKSTEMDIFWQIPVNTTCFPEGSRCMRTG